MIDSIFRSTLGGALDPGAEFLGFISSIFENGDGPSESVVVQFLSGGDVGPEAVGLAGADPDHIKRLLDFAKEIGGGKLGAIIETLGKPISSLPEDGIGWGFSPSASTNIPAGSLTVHAGAAANLGARILPNPLTLHIEGGLGVEAGVTVPFQYGSLSIDGSARGDARLDFRFAHDSGLPLYAALAADLPRAARLTSPEKLIAPHDVGGLKNATLALVGQVNLGAKLAAGRSWSTTRSVKTGKSSGSIALTADVGASYGVRWSKASDYQMTIEPSPDGQIRVRLDDSDTSALERSLSIGANLKVEGLDEILTPLIEHYGKIPSDLKDLVGKYSPPSSLLKEKLGELVANAPDLIEDVVDGLTGKSDAQELIGGLSDKLVELADAKLGGWTDLLRGEVADLAAQAISSLPLDEEHREDAEEQIEELLAKAARKLQEEATGLLRKKLEAAGDPIASFLGQFSDRFDRLLDDIDERASQLTEPFFALIERVQQVREKLQAAVEATTRDQLAVQFTRTVRTKATAKTLLTFLLDPRDAQAKSLYRSMLTGDFEDAIQIGLDPSAPAVTLEEGLFTDFLERYESTGLTFNLFGIGAEAGSILTSELQVESDASGNIRVFRSKTELKRYRKFLGESRSIGVSSAVSLLETSTVATPFTIRLNHQDEDLTTRELQQFLLSLERAELITPGTKDRAIKSYDTLGIDDPDGDRALNVDVVFPLTREQLERIHAHGEDTVEEAAVDVQLRMYRVFGRPELLDVLDQKGGGARSFVLGARDGHPIRKQVRGMFGLRSKKGTNNKATTLTVVVRWMADNADGLWNYLDELHDLRRISLPDVAPGERMPRAFEKEIDKRHRDAVKELDRWLQVRGGIRRMLSRDERASLWSLALMATLQELTGQRFAASPIVSWKDAEGNERRIALM